MIEKRLRVMLAPQHKLFADQFLITGKIQESARKAGYAHGSAHVSGSRLLKRPDVQQYLAQQAAKVTEQTESLQGKVLSELQTMAFANIADLITIDDDGTPRVDFSAATEDQLKAVTSIATKRRVTTDKDGNETIDTEARLAIGDKYRGLELLGKYLGMFKEPEQRITLDIADRLVAGRRRLVQLSDAADSENFAQGGRGAGV
jgi:phage terminase small subunit